MTNPNPAPDEAPEDEEENGVPFDDGSTFDDGTGFDQ